MQQLFIFFCVVVIVGCNSPDNKPGTLSEAASKGSVHADASDTLTTDAAPFVLSGCYEMTLKRDTVFLQLDVTDTLVSGTLIFDFYEKDRNEGSLKGVLRNDQIIGFYTFQSEGIQSVREVVFKIHNQTLLSGFGALEEQNGRLVFKDKNGLQYQTSNPYIKVACP